MPGDSTISVHGDRSRSELPDVAPAIRPATTFVRGAGRTYRRDSHETTERFEAVIGALEGGHAVAYPSGMAAVAAAMAHVRPRQVSIPDDVYHGVRALIGGMADRGDIAVVPEDALEAGDLWWIETPSNPRCLITDLGSVATQARTRGVVTVCDATFATPVLLHPLDFGIDLVVHAATKAIAGHSDVMGGLLVVADEGEAAELRGARTVTGAVPGSLDVWLALRGVRTLALRTERSTVSAGAIARWFADRGIRTWYPGLEDHPGHDIAARQMLGMGSMLAVDLGDEATADRVIDALSLFTNATSLGGVESLVERRALSDPTMPPGLVRFSVGIEDVEDLLEDLDHAMADARW